MLRHNYAFVLSFQVKCFHGGTQSIFEKRLSELTDVLSQRHETTYGWIFMGSSDEVYHYDLLVGHIPSSEIMDRLRKTLHSITEEMDCIGDFEDTLRPYRSHMYEDVTKTWIGTINCGTRYYEV